MKTVSVLLLTFVITLGSAVPLPAQSTAPKAKTTSAQNAATSEQLRALSDQSIDPAYFPVKMVAEFLQLRPAQVDIFVNLLQTRQSAVLPLLVNIQQRQVQLDQLLQAGGPAPAIGVLALQIRGWQNQVLAAQQDFLKNWQSSLDSNQLLQLQAVRLAQQLQPILPAFQQLALP